MSIIYVYQYYDEEQTIPAVFVQLNDNKKFEICILEPNDKTRTLDTVIINTFDTVGEARLGLQQYHEKENEIRNATYEGLGILLSGRKFN
jgi:hypothetical protein